MIISRASAALKRINKQFFVKKEKKEKKNNSKSLNLKGSGGEGDSHPLVSWRIKPINNC